MTDYEVRVTDFPRIVVRRKVSEWVDEEWRIDLKDGKPVHVSMRTIIYTDGHDPVVKSDPIMDVSPADVPKSVVSKVEEHMTPRGAFN